ncbi:hypothetical protein ACJJTC_005136 [Scirpophaga incertulas]
MSKLFVLSALLMLTCARADLFDKITAGIDKIISNINKEIVAIKQPMLETAVTVANSQCTLVKKIFGLNYDQLNNTDNEPDLNQLSLNYVTPEVNLTININQVARLLPKSPTFNYEHFVIYVHGFTDDPSKQSFQNISTGFIKRGFYNILALDGSSLIKWLYLRSSTYVRFIGEKLGSILADLVAGGLPPQNIHVIGHSLGAHISGFTGKQFTVLTGEKVGRITGLDPAGPCFAQLDSSLRINSTDADFVDAIHTNGGVAGMKDRVGQVDFYPNAGEQQPECLIDTCSHSRAWLYFGASLLDELSFPAIACDSWKDFKNDNCDHTSVSYMGIAAQPGTEGAYYLQTTGEWPFSKGIEGITYVKNEGIIKGILP